MEQPIGIHLRIQDSYTKLLEETITLGATCCQFFFIPQKSNSYVQVTPQDKQSFLALKKNIHVFGHASYWVNLAAANPVSIKATEKLLVKEAGIAQELDIPYIVTHAGSAKDFTSHRIENGIKAAANMINTCKGDTCFLVENTAHGGNSVCSNLEDFITLKKLLDPDANVGFCFDTAHAFSYGYEFDDTDKLIRLLDKTMGLKHIKLIHLNDSKRACGSQIDQHALPGEGLIGKKALQKFITHDSIKHIPIIIEPPQTEPTHIATCIKTLKHW